MSKMWRQSLEREKAIAEYICATQGEGLLEDGVTVGGATLAERFEQKWHANGFSGASVWAGAAALRHWVASAGFDNSGKYTYHLNEHRNS